MFKKSLTRSPLNDKPLRYPGQSLDNQIQKIIVDDASSYIISSVFCIVFAGMEWWRWYQQVKPNPVFWTFLALGIAAYSSIKLISYKKRIKKLKLARDGERVVGQYLESLREKGYRIYHDLIGDHFNLDHVIISDRGIFVVETKTYSKPAKGDAKVVYTGNEIIVNGFDTGDRILTQAKAEANWLKNIIQESTGKQFPVIPIVVFPGWFVDTTKNKNTEKLWVLSPKQLPSFIERLPVSIDKHDMMLVSYHISRFIRVNYEKKN